MPEPIRTTIVIPSDVEVEIIDGDCDCAEGTVCAGDDPWAPECPRRAALNPQDRP